MLTPITTPLPRPPLRPRDEHGFTLVETLVATVTGLVVMAALFTILDISMRQSSRLSESAQSTQRGRATMTRIQDMLHSACISPKFTPVKEGSKETKLVFVNAYGEQAEVPKAWTTREVTEGATKRKVMEGVRWDEIEWNEGAQTITDTYALSTGETSTGVYSYGEKTKVKIGEYVSKIGTTPIFTYYEYATTPATATSAASTTLTAKKPPATGFTELEAGKIAAVGVSFNTAPNFSETTATKRLTEGRTADLTSSTTFAFSAPNAEASITAGPCE